jgi:hypothetical protein
MNNQWLLPQEAPTGSEPVQPGQKDIFHQMIRAWLRFSGPDPRRFRATIEDQELLRRSRLLSALFSLIMVAILLTAPTAIPVPTYWIPIIAFLLLGLVALILNRGAYVTISGVFYILAIDATLTILMATLPTGIRNSNIPDFDLFIIPTLIGGVVLPRRFVPFLAALHICITIALFTLLPHDPLLTQEITLNQKGFAYAELSDAFLIQIVGATIAWLGAWSVDRALLRASRAEEVAEARKRLNEQAQQIVAQKHRLDYGMSILKEAQARFANGDYTARVKLQDNELTPLALSFNLLAERLYRITQIAQEYTRLEQALQQLFEIQNTLFYGGPLKPYPATGTLVDHLYFSFQRYDQLRHSVDKGGSSVERVRRELTQQKLLLTQLDTILAQTHAVVRLLPNDTHRPHLSSVELIEKAQQVSTQITGQEQRCQQEMKLLEQLLRGR